ncbi:hypothetical protein F4779DRAFT_537949 [Xylariaceae sp. FL0662B]|nr:hypothetical protein F4779DRAFT_537949 [Xylariaceae sp. FL0662B]
MAPKPQYSVSFVDFNKDWDDLFLTYWDAWKSPLQAVGRLTFADIGKGGPQEAKSFDATKQAFRLAAQKNAGQRWVKVEDLNREGPGLSRIVGGGAWTEYADNPFRSLDFRGDRAVMKIPEPPSPGFLPGSECYDLSREFYTQMWSRRPKYMRTAHVYGQAIWTISEYRQLGATGAMMEFWTGEIDKLGVEAYRNA